MSLTLDLRKIARQRKQSLRKVYQGTMFSMAARVIDMSPVDEGTFRGNWFTGVGFEDYSTDLETNTITDSINRLIAGVNGLDITENFYFMNNLPYAKDLEDGSSKQAPVGMVKVVINDFEQIASQNIMKFR